MQIPGYQIERELGQGGMAIVYLALQESLHRQVALKIIKPILTANEEFAQRFLREGRIVAQLNDPHIVTIYDIGSHEGLYYLSIEYLPGGTLQQRIERGLSLADALFIARSIAGALDYAHHRGIIHRDIKPQNILFRENGTPVLTDFGIAKTLGSSTVMTHTGVSVGTPRYMSPEQIRGQTIDARADLYSFGVMLYEMLVGKVPYAAEDSFALAMMHVTAPTPELPKHLSRFQHVLNKLLEKDPDQRLQSGQDVVAVLNSIESDASERSLANLVRADPPSDRTQIQVPRRAGVSAGKNPVSPAPGAAAGPRRASVSSGKNPVSPAPGAVSASGVSPRLGWKAGILVAGLTLAAAGGGYWYIAQPGGVSLADLSSTKSGNTASSDAEKQRYQETDRLLVEARQQQLVGAPERNLATIDQGLVQVQNPSDLLALREEATTQTRAKADNVGEQLRLAQMRADQFLEKARLSHREGAIEESLDYIEQGLQAIPNHSGLLNLKRKIQRTQVHQRKQAEAERQRQAEAERQRQAEAERQRQAEAERQRQAEAERQRQAEAERQQQAEAERQQQAEAERQRQAEQAERERIAAGFLKRARNYQRDGAYESSLLQIEKGLRQVPDDQRLLALRRKVRKQLRHSQAESSSKSERKKASQVAALLRKCNTHLRANRLTSGRGGNAADCYDEVLQLDRNNADALAGIARITDRYAGLIVTALKRNKIKQARSYLARMESVDPNHKRLSDLQQRIVRTETSLARSRQQQVQKPSPEPQLKRKPEPSIASASKPVEPPPIHLVSVQKPGASKAAIVRQDRHTQVAKIETKDNVSLQVTTTSKDTSKKKGRKQAKPDRAPQLFVRANVENARVWINNRMVGTTPLAVDMPTGSFRVRVRRKGYGDWNGRVDLAAGDERLIKVSLSRKVQANVVKAPDPPKPQQPAVPRFKQQPAKPKTPSPASSKKTRPKPEPEPKPERQVKSSRQAPNCLRGNCENGRGVYRYPDGSTYSGDFRNAKMHGQGTYNYARRREKYKGQWRNGVFHGQGSYFYRSGNRYKGQWRNGLKSGKGVYYYARYNEKYVGHFASDQPDGYGVYYYSNGSRYEGQWRNGRKNGKGTLYEGGRKLVGEWRNDQKIHVRVVDE